MTRRRTFAWRDMGWRRWWNWKLSVTRYGDYDGRGRFHWNGNINIWIGPISMTSYRNAPLTSYRDAL
jgi:hypothetical protein